MDSQVSRRQALIGIPSAALVAQTGLALAAPTEKPSLFFSLRLAQWQRCIVTENDEKNRRVYITAEFSPATEATRSLQRVNLLWYRNYWRHIDGYHPDLASIFPIDIDAMRKRDDVRSLRNGVQNPWLLPEGTSERGDLYRGKAFDFWLARSALPAFAFDLKASGSIVDHAASGDGDFTVGCRLECGDNSRWLTRQQSRHDPLSSWLFEHLCTQLKSQPFPLAPSDGGLWMPYSFIRPRGDRLYV